MIQSLLGQNDIKTTLRYTHVSTKELGKTENPPDAILRKKKLPSEQGYLDSVDFKMKINELDLKPATINEL